MPSTNEWEYAGPADAGDANGEICIHCGQRLVAETRPGRWVVRKEDDDLDADFAVREGYTHFQCTEARQAQAHRSRFELPEVPRGPRDV